MLHAACFPPKPSYKYSPNDLTLNSKFYTKKVYLYVFFVLLNLTSAIDLRKTWKSAHIPYIIGAEDCKYNQQLKFTIQWPIQKAKNLPECVRSANSLAAAGDVVLLSPACSSFDMFKDYKERGRVFKEAVRRIGGSQ